MLGTMLGLGGGDVWPQHLTEVLNDLLEREQASAPRIVEVVV